MTRNVEIVSIDSSLKVAATKMRELDVGLIPVCDGDRLQGMVSDRDITIRATADGRDPVKTKVSEIMSTDIAYCLEDQEVEEAISLFNGGSANSPLTGPGCGQTPSGHRESRRRRGSHRRPRSDGRDFGRNIAASRAQTLTLDS